MSYLKEAASKLLSNDGLVLFAKGLGIDEVWIDSFLYKLVVFEILKILL